MLVVPAHSPYERQLLREYLEMLVGHGAPLMLGMDGARWLVRPRTLADSRCTACTQVLGRLHCSLEEQGTATCLDCAMQPVSHARIGGQDA